jgi:D-serine deaminase-like pyridoxal phosphate-dependent protein
MFYSELDTPCVVIDETKMESNIDRFHNFANELGIAVRPHIKTHKMPYIARKQEKAGAVGITCQKLTEAEVFSDAGFEDILITYNIVGSKKLSRLVKLANEVPRLAVVADSETVLEGLSEAFFACAKPLDILIECDTGAGRCGVQSPKEAVRLAQYVSRLPGVKLRGLMTYPAPYNEAQVNAWFKESEALAAEIDIKFDILSSGGTPSMWELAKAPIINEYRIGTYVYQDRSQVSAGACTIEECALTVLTTVVSVPVSGRVIIDAGSKALTSDLLGQEGYGQVQGYPEARVVSLSEEHGVLQWPVDATQPRVGDRLSIIPNHACPVSNLYDEVNFVRGGQYRHSRSVSARGKVV